MGFSMELVKAKRRIKELEEDIADLLEQTALGQERPSPPDIVKPTAILVDTQKLTLHYGEVNIPFTSPPMRLNVLDIPDTGSMDGAMDYGHSNLYLEPANEDNQRVMVDWLAKQWLDSKGMLAADCVYRIMYKDNDDPRDFTKPHKWYAIHRVVEVGVDSIGRYFWFAGINNIVRDPYMARDKNILWVNIGTIF